MLDQVVSQSNQLVDSQKYSKIYDWKKLNQHRGPKIPKENNSSMVQMIEKHAREVPAPNKYNTFKKVKIKGTIKSSLPKFTFIQSIAFDKKGIPGPNVYKPEKGLAEISKERNFKRARTAIVRLKKKEKPYPAPGGEMTDTSFEFVRQRPQSTKVGKAKRNTYIDQSIKKSRQSPGVGRYNLNYLSVSAMPLLLKRLR